jgi:hypothetical protein
MKYLTPMEFLAANPGKLGRNLLYNEINAGRIPHIRVGRRILVPEDAWDQMLAAQALTTIPGVAEPPAEAGIYLHGVVDSQSSDSAC